MDQVLQAFLAHQAGEAAELSRSSDFVAVLPMAEADGPPQRYLVDFRTKVLVWRAGRPLLADCGCGFDLWFPPDYLRKVEPWMVLSCAGPRDLFHPNIRPPSVCIGRIDPGTPLSDLVLRLYDLVTFRKWASHDALNPDAAQWARKEENQKRFPIEDRPLRRRKHVIRCESEEAHR